MDTNRGTLAPTSGPRGGEAETVLVDNYEGRFRKMRARGPVSENVNKTATPLSPRHSPNEKGLTGVKVYGCQRSGWKVTA